VTTATALAEPIASPGAVDAEPAIPTRSPLHRWLRDTWVMTRRNLVHVRREPMQLSDVTIQPVLFVFLFVYVFGAGVALPGGADYADFAVAGLLALNLTTGSVGTAVGISNDIRTGIVNRFRTLPLARSSVLVGRSISDLLSAVLAATLVCLTGLVVGWRPDDVPGLLGGVAVVLLFAYAISWGTACLGLVSQGPEAAAGVAFVLLFPLSFVSNAFVPTEGMPKVLEVIANWNPVSAVTASARELFGNPNPSAAVDAWPMQHPTIAALGWSLLLLAIFVPTAVRLYRRATTD
jgi:ABC-2 type transport system permease protein